MLVVLSDLVSLQRILKLLLEASDLKFVFQELVDLVDEDAFTLGDFAFDVHDLLGHKFVDALDVFEHFVGLEIQALEHSLILAELVLFVGDERLRVHAADDGRIVEGLVLSLQRLVYVAQRVVGQILGLDLRVLKFHVVLLDDLVALAVAGFPDLANVAGEALREHVLLQAVELNKDVVVQELLRDRKRVKLAQSHVRKHRPLA